MLVVSESRMGRKHSAELQEPFNGRPLGGTSCLWPERHGHQICGEVGGPTDKHGPTTLGRMGNRCTKHFEHEHTISDVEL